MFHAAIMLANQYNIRIHNESITSNVIQVNNDENGHASLNLLCQYITTQRPNIVGIVGPDSSTTARFINPFASHVNLPLVSYAATNIDLADRQLYPTFYRTVPSDLLLARAIIHLFKQFEWKTCTMIFQKSDYGYGGLRILSENYHNNITIKAQLLFDGDKFHADLKQTLETSRSIIVLVWADEQQTTNIIKRAFEERLINTRYVWITTNKVIILSYLAHK
ncbi:unnamed protein product [Rotaria sp. Silwood2]|nr:unnamed protein product [Rotaria sp. Silwood2]CAF4510352.1 unnamed protein product [Rotaria sp. Silwood2]